MLFFERSTCGNRQISLKEHHRQNNTILGRYCGMGFYCLVVSAPGTSGHYGTIDLVSLHLHCLHAIEERELKQIST